MNGKILIGDKIYKLASKTLSDSAYRSYFNKENVKIPLKCSISIKENTPITFNVTSFNNTDMNIKIKSSIIPIKATDNPITKERITAQIVKTNNTPFEFKEIHIDLADGLYIPKISALNELRRMALSQVEDFIISGIKRNSKVKLDKIDDTFTISEISSNKTISVLLNIIKPEYDYTSLSTSVENIYIPLRHFFNKENSKALQDIVSNFNVYIYMPLVIKSNYKNLIMHHLEEILESYNIKGFIISNIADLEFLQKYSNYVFCGNYTLNLFNKFTMLEYQKLGINKFTLSPELNIDDINYITQYDSQTELIVYGNTPIMTSNYCLLGKSNKCYPECSTLCRSNNSYYLRDRLNLDFRILPDNIQTITTIYNSKTTCITHLKLDIPNLRIDILDEDINTINNIVNCAINGQKLEGNQYTYGNLNREV